MQTGKTTILILICAVLLGACGLKGPLYLPDEKPAAEQKTAPDKEAEKEDTAKKDSTSRH